MEHAGRIGEDCVEVLGDESSIGPHGVDEAAILAPHVDDQGLTGRLRAVRLQRRAINALATERFRGETSEDVVADPGTDR